MLATTPIGSRRMIEVWPARNSFAARPSMTRAAPAKNRNRSTHTEISSIAAPTGLPAFWLSSRPISSAARLERVGDLEQDQAAVLGRRLLPGLECLRRRRRPRGRRPRRSSRDFGDDLAVGRVLDVEVSPAAASTNSPPMNCWYVFTRSSVRSRTGPPRARGTARGADRSVAGCRSIVPRCVAGSTAARWARRRGRRDAMPS